jgi:hypothetical protein
MARVPMAALVYEAADAFRQRCLLEGRSLLWLQQKVWTPTNLSRLRDSFSEMEAPEIEAKGFLGKWREQLANDPPEIHRIAADVLAFYWLCPTNVGSGRKLEQIREVVSWKLTDDPPDYSVVEQALGTGFANPGQSYLISRNAQIAFYIAFANEVRAGHGDPRDSDKSKSLADAIMHEIKKSKPARHVLLHLLFPDRFERIVSHGDKERVVEFFQNYAKDASDVDDALSNIRGKLEQNYGRKIDFYDREIRDQWKPDGDTEGDGEDTKVVPPKVSRSLEVQHKPVALSTEMPIFHELEEPEKKELSEVVKLAQDGQVAIPLFQREFVWTRQDISDLFESILRGYYVGSLLFWTVNGDPDLKIEAVYGTGITEDKLKPRYLILDGQQRVSAIFYATAGPNRPLWNTKRPYVFFIDLRKLLEIDSTDEPAPLVISLPRTDAEKVGLMKQPAQFQKWYFPIFEFKNFHEWLDNFGEHMESRTDISQDKAREIKKRLRLFLRQVWEKFEIPIIKLPEGMQLVDVAKIFEKLNSTGVILTVFDLLNARMVKHNIGLREMWDSAKETSPLLKQFSEGNDRFPVYLLQTIALLRDKPSKSEELLKLVPENFRSDWERACQTIERALRKITNLREDGYGVLSNKWLPYMTMLPVLANLLERLEKRDDKPVCISKAKSWYWSSIITHAYSGSTDTQVSLDSRQLLEWFEDDGKVPETVLEARREMKSLNLGQVSRMSDAVYKGVMCLVALKGGRDFRKVDMIEFSTLDDHHIFPKSKTSEFNAGNKINAIANKTLIERETNENYIRNARPSQYLARIMREQGISEDEMSKRLETHLITPSAFKALMADDFASFVSLRESAIENELNSLIERP